MKAEQSISLLMQEMINKSSEIYLAAGGMVIATAKNEMNAGINRTKEEI